MLNPQPAPLSHEDLFVQRYQLLLAWSRKLTNGNLQMAEDLLHDVFVQFTLARPALDSIQNLDGYLYRMLRNRHLSAIRRTARAPVDDLSSAQFDSAEIRLRSADPRDHLKVLDDLRTICRYACARKRTSRAGSILILRFFLGYYPGEIIQITRSSRQAVDSWLRIARMEAQAYLQDPARLAFLRQPNQVSSRSSIHAYDDFLNELRSAIFNSCEGECPASPGLQEIYAAPASVGSEVLAHIVSCAACLDAANSLLGLPPLRDRCPVDTVGRDRGPRDGDGGSGITKATGLTQSRRKSREVYEHSPAKLNISVNGFTVGTQTISSETSEVSLNVNVDEKIAFVEVHSEQDLLMLGLDIDPPPDGPPEQSARIDLSEGRSLELFMSFAAAWPSVRVSYRDPALRTASEGTALAIEAASSDASEVELASETPAGSVEAERGAWNRVASRLRNWHARLLDLVPEGFWFRPATITAVLAILLVAALVVVRLPVPAVSAAALLDKASESEKLVMSKPDTAVRRSLTLEARNVTLNLVMLHRKIETWRTSSAIDGQGSVRRLYDEEGKLVAGEFVDRGGVSRTYRSAAASAEEKNSVPAYSLLLMGREIWTIDPSASSFRTLIGDPRRAAVTQDSKAFAISFDNEHTRESQQLVKGSLILAKPGLHVTEEKLQVRRGEDLIEYKFVEDTFEEVKPAALPAGVFKVDPPLIPSAGFAPVPGAGSISGSGPTPRANEGATASADLEVEVEYLLDRAKANMGEQVTVSRTADDKLLVSGIVETESRKNKILEALGGVAHNPAVKIDISTVEEMARRQKPSNTTATVQRLDIEAGEKIPVYSELRRHLLSRGVSEEHIDDEIQRFSAKVLQESAEALRHAWALGRIAEQISRTVEQGLGSEARSKQLVMITQHASSCVSEYELLRRDLEPVLGAASGPSEAVTINDETDLARMLRMLVAQAGAADAAVRSAFTISSGSSDYNEGVRARLRTPLIRAEALAASIARFARDHAAIPVSPGE